MEDIKELKAKYLELSEKAQEVREQLRSSIIDLMKTILKKYDGKVDFRSDEEFYESYSYSMGSVTITYDGGNHPEYASNAFSEVSGVKLIDDTVYFDCEESDKYSVDRVWSVDELEQVADALLLYNEYMDKK